MSFDLASPKFYHATETNGAVSQIQCVRYCEDNYTSAHWGPIQVSLLITRYSADASIKLDTNAHNREL